MKNSFSNLVSLFLISLAALSAAAQTSVSNAASRDETKKSGVSVRYDAVKDETYVFLYPYLLIYNDGWNLLDAESLRMMAGFTNSGKIMSVPKNIEFEFVSYMKTGWRFVDQEDRKVTVSTDGENFDLGEMNRTYAGKTSFINQQNIRYVENLNLEVPFETFQKVASSKKVRLKIGSQEIKLRKEHIALLQELLSATR